MIAWNCHREETVIHQKFELLLNRDRLIWIVFILLKKALFSEVVLGGGGDITSFHLWNTFALVNFEVTTDTAVGQVFRDICVMKLQRSGNDPPEQ